MMGIGFPELMIILVIIMIIFGAGKLPEIGNAFGRSIKNFKQSMKEADQEDAELETSASSEATGSEATGSEATGSEATGSETATAETANSQATSSEQGQKIEGKAQAVKKAAKTEEEKMIEEAARELKEKRIGTIKTKHDGLVQQNDVFTNSLARTPFGRGRDRGVSRDVF